MEVTQKMQKQYEFPYMPCLLEMRVTLFMNEIGGNKTKENLRKSVSHFIEGKCISEGYVKPNTVNVQSYTSGTIKGEKVEFLVVFECSICNPSEGTRIHNCKVNSKTKAGIHASVKDGNFTPVTVFVIRDHFLENRNYEDVKEGDLIDISVIGSRFELNDACVEVLGKLLPKTTEQTNK